MGQNSRGRGSLETSSSSLVGISLLNSTDELEQTMSNGTDDCSCQRNGNNSSPFGAGCYISGRGLCRRHVLLFSIVSHPWTMLRRSQWNYSIVKESFRGLVHLQETVLWKGPTAASQHLVDLSGSLFEQKGNACSSQRLCCGT